MKPTQRHLLPNPLNEYPWLTRLILWLQKRKYGAPLESSLIWGKVPRLLLAFLKLNRVFNHRKSLVTPELRSLLAIFISQKNHCSFCIDLNLYISDQRHIPYEKITALVTYKGNALFSNREKLVLEYTEQIVLRDNHQAHELLPQLKQHFSQAEIVELTAFITFQNMSCLFNTVLQVPSQELCKIPEDKL